MSRCGPTTDWRAASCRHPGDCRGIGPFALLLGGCVQDSDSCLGRCAPVRQTVFPVSLNTWEFPRSLPLAQDADSGKSAILDVPLNISHCEPTKALGAPSCRHPGA